MTPAGCPTTPWRQRFVRSDWTPMSPRPDRTGDALSRASELLRSYRGQGRAKSWERFAEGEGLPEPVPASRWHESKRPDARGSSSIALSRRRVGVIVLG